MPFSPDHPIPPKWLRGGNRETLYAKTLQRPAPAYRRELIPDRFGEDLVAPRGLAGVRAFALQEARTEGTPVAFQLMAASWDRKRWEKRRRELVECVQAAGFDRYILRFA